jgi:hypothetical protein
MCSSRPNLGTLWLVGAYHWSARQESVTLVVEVAQSFGPPWHFAFVMCMSLVSEKRPLDRRISHHATKRKHRSELGKRTITPNYVKIL